MNCIIMVLTSLIWWSLCIQSQIELEPQDFRTCTETFRAKSCRWKCIFNNTFFTFQYYFQYYTIFQVLDLNDPKLVQAIWKPEVLYLEGFGNTPNTESTFQLYPWPGLLPKCQGGRVPVCYGSQSTSEHQAPWSDSLYAQVSIFMQTSQSYS